MGGTCIRFVYIVALALWSLTYTLLEGHLVMPGVTFKFFAE
jgi:hypothetical protein